MAVLLRLLLDPGLNDRLPLPTLFGAVALTVWFGGYRPALLAVVLGYLACDWLFIEPRGTLGIDNARDLIGLCSYLLSCGIIIGFGQAMHVARRSESRQRQRAEETLKRFMESSPFGIAILDSQMRYLLINGPLADMNGIPVEDHLGKTVAEVLPHVHRQVESVFQQVMGAGSPVLGYEIEGETAREPGVRRWWEENCFPVFDSDGHPTAVGFIAQEVTDRKRAQEALAQSEERLRRLVEANIIGVIEADGGGSIHRANDAFLRMVGYNQEDLQRGKVRWSDMTPPEYLPLDYQRLREAQELRVCGLTRRNTFVKTAAGCPF